jgi:cation:H+ antiporter
MEIAYAILGLTILVLAGDLLVRGAVNVSLRLGVPALIVSLTIVAVGTSAPELLISIKAVVDNVPGIAVGNVVGSNIANILLVLGVPAMMAGLGTAACDTRDSYMQMLVGTAVFVAFALYAPITWVHGTILLVLYFVFMAHAIRAARHHRRAECAVGDDADVETDVEPGDVEGADPGAAWWKIGVYLVLGIIGLPLGADILVESATSIARSYDISETVIGLTLVAVGTSLPELATTVSAAFRKQADVALGNVLGSNMANLLGIVGAASYFGNIPVSDQIVRFDLWVMVASSLLLVPFVFMRVNITRTWGVVFTGLYVAYVVWVLA